jgi:hypothetical protein
MAYDQGLAERLRVLFDPLPASSEQRMFGGICFMVAGKMCCGIVGRNLVVRVGAEGWAEALRRPNTKPMTFTGRAPMRGFIYVTPEGWRTTRSLSSSVDRTVRFAASLPPRAAAPKRRRRRTPAR